MPVVLLFLLLFWLFKVMIAFSHARSIIIIIIIVVVEFFTYQLWLGNIHLSWDVVINRIRLGGLTCSLKSFLRLNMCQELQIFAVVCMYVCIRVQVKSC